MAMPFHAGVLRPKIERYGDDRFRQLRHNLRPYKIDYHLALELVAFLGVVDHLPSASWMFHGKLSWRRAAKVLQDHLGEEAKPLIRANKEALTVDDGLMMLSAMQDGGWKHGQVPPPVEMAILALRKRRMKDADIANFTGLTLANVRNIATASRRRDARRKRDVDHAFAVGSLSF